MAKIVSQLDKNGYYVGQVVADESPLEPGVYLIPAGAVDSTPPEIPEGHVAKWDGTWSVEQIPVTETETETNILPDMSTSSFYSCNPWQIRKALNALGLRQQVEDTIASSTDITIKDGWEFASEFRSDDPFVISVGEAVGKSAPEVAEIISYAATL